MSESSPNHDPGSPRRDDEASQEGFGAEDVFAMPDGILESDATEGDAQVASGDARAPDEGGTDEMAAEAVGISPAVESLMRTDPAADGPGDAQDGVPRAAEPVVEAVASESSLKKEPGMADETAEIDLIEAELDPHPASGGATAQAPADSGSEDNDLTRLITTSPDELASDAVTSNPDETAAVELDEFDLQDNPPGTVLTIPMMAHPLDVVRPRQGDSESYALAAPGPPGDGPREQPRKTRPESGDAYELSLDDPKRKPPKKQGSRSKRGKKSGAASAKGEAVEWIPRGLILVQCLWLLGSWAVALMLDSTVPAMRWMVLSAVVGMLLIWPALRLSQGHPRLAHVELPPARPSPRKDDSRLPTYLLSWPPVLILRDCIAMLAVFQAVIWPLRLSAGWSLSQTLWLDAAAAAWTLLIGAVTAWGCLSSVGLRRTLTMAACVVILIAEPLVVAAVRWLGSAGPQWHWHMRISPVEVLWVMTRPQAGWQVGSWPQAIAATAVAAGLLWVAALVAGRSRRVNG